VRTFGDFHLSNGLPFIHGNEPGGILAAAAQVNDKFGRIIGERFQDRLKARK
jgi:hypothetical protein